MTQVSIRAAEVLHDLLVDPATPVEIKRGIWERMATPSPEQTRLLTAEQIARDPGQPRATRLQALEAIIEISKGG